MKRALCLFAVIAIIAIVFSGCRSAVEETEETTNPQSTTETTEETTKEEIIGITDRDLLNDSQIEMMDKFPEYFGLNASDGLDVMVCQFSQNSYYFGLVESGEKNQDDNEGILTRYISLKVAMADEMRIILSTYNVDESDITIVPYQNPLSSYICPYFFHRDGEDHAEKQRQYINSIYNMLFRDE
ncbi:MAG: hypothetical protein K6F14_00855 [Clostridiales bacterium]|nr:hypothetical protein [Clostridiales bacterium]